MRKLSALAVAVCALVCAAPLTASAAQILNGSFEMGVNPPTDGFRTLGLNNNDITGWTVTNGSVDWIGTYWQASDGTHSLDLSGGSAGAISTSIMDLVVGNQYRIDFDLAGNPDGDPARKTGFLQVSTAGNVTSGTSFNFNTTGRTRQDMGWQPEFLIFTAQDVTQTLTFASSTDTAYGPALDNVRISAVAGVPELSTWAMMGLGFLGLGFAGRKRMRRAEVV